MSPVTAPARKTAPARRTTPRPARPNLRLVTPVSSRAPRAPFVLFSMLVVGAGLVALLVLNTVVAQDAFTLHDLGASKAELAEREQKLGQEVAALEAPGAVAERAHALGLVQAGDPAFLAPNGRVLGSAAPATAPPPPPPPPPSPAASAKPSATPAPKPAP